MATNQLDAERTETSVESRASLRNGAILMTLAGVAFVGYGVVFLALAFFGSGFELGVSTLDGVTRAELAASNPETAYYITHLHVATAGFIVATGLAVAALSWFGVRSGQRWALVAAVATSVLALGIALPMHYADGFGHDWLVHLGPIYLATLAFLVGVVLAFRGVRASSPAEA